jgi:hypothetical protein
MDLIGNSASLLVLILLADLAITFFHSYQEWKGVGAPLWRNFGAIVGFEVPDKLGFCVFTVLLTLFLFAIGIIGILDFLGSGPTAAALGLLIGARLSDTIVSHALLYTVGYRPNPGFSSTPLYVIEAFFLGWFFQVRLASAPYWATGGMGFGAVIFVLVLPALRAARWLWPARKRTPWSTWQQIPSWASTNI